MNTPNKNFEININLTVVGAVLGALTAYSEKGDALKYGKYIFIGGILIPIGIMAVLTGSIFLYAKATGIPITKTTT